ncbi:asparaginase [Streptomyces sp. NPDC088560]|uniref:asparaginase n=1 Tax=Streptomyces sp. NPDC088560 TaxID=3365868 RepID=UPI0038304259
MDSPVIAEAVRSGFVESRHRGAFVVLDTDGSPTLRAGDVQRPVFPRSSAKPLQAVALVHPVVALAGQTLAITAGSHEGQPYHVAAVREILRAAGLDETCLGTPAALPWPPEPYLRQGGRARSILMNCSGQHAAMLAVCVAEGWTTEGYLRPGHPVQLRVRAALEELTGERTAHLGVDGCGVPVPAFSLLGLARAFQRLATAPAGTPAAEVAAAMIAHPRFVAGTEGLDTRLMQTVPGLLAKSGAEGMQCVALPDGRALALSVEDGARRAVGPVVAAVLRRLGIAGPEVEAVCRSRLPGAKTDADEVRATVALS